MYIYMRYTMRFTRRVTSFTMRENSIFREGILGDSIATVATSSDMTLFRSYAIALRKMECHYKYPNYIYATVSCL